MSDRPWPKTARVLRITGAVIAAIGLVAAIVPWLLVGDVLAATPGAAILLTGALFFVYAYTYYAQHPDRIDEYDGRGDGII